MKSYKTFDVISKLVLTEKPFKLGQGSNLLVLNVKKNATKSEIKTAVEEIFDVKVRKVNTVNYRGKSKRTKFNTQGKRRDFKRAYVYLAEGYKVDVFS
ncbi:MAG: 50S ribosomal protein L23 [Deltaproteobacteria bacterium]|nr:50S ribosomal protein L23 [Deltaproteobacteria bacterium]